MLHISILFYVIAACIVVFLVFKGWLVGYDLYSAAKIDKEMHAQLTERIGNITHDTKPEERARLQEDIAAYHAFVAQHRAEIETGDSMASFLDDPAAGVVSEYMSHSVSGRIFIIGVVNWYGFAEGTLQWFTSQQMNNALQSFIEESGDAAAIQNNQMIALAITFIATLFFTLSKTGVEKWAAYKLGEDGPTPIYRTRNVYMRQAMHQKSV